MKVGERGQVTIPKDIRDRFGIGPDTDVESLRKWKGYCGSAFREAGYDDVDQFINEVRGEP